MNNFISRATGSSFAGKKLLFTLPILALLAAGCGSSPTSSATPPASNQTQLSASTVVISNFAFSPASLTVKQGTTVTWTNQDSTAHTVTGDTSPATSTGSGTTSGSGSSNGGPASGNLANGASYSFTFSQTGIFSYHCSIHPNMTASVTVTQ